MNRQSYRQRVKDALPGTRRDIEVKTGLSKNCVWRWIEDLHAVGECHITRWERPEKGPYMPRYAPGPGKDKLCDLVHMTVTEKAKRYRKRARADGSWQDRLAQQRSKYWADKAAERGDPLLNLFYGRAGNNSLQK